MKQAVIVVAVVCLLGSLVSTVSSENVVCYFSSWAVYRQGNGSFGIDNIDPNLCTHINFAFIGLNEDGTILEIDPWESSDPRGYNGFRKIVELKKVNPNVKVMVSMGGWNEASGKYSKLAADSALRKTLAKNVYDFVVEKGFDGFDLDWEYPGYGEGSQPDIDKDNFVALLSELSELLKPKGLLLSAAVPGRIERIDLGFDVPRVSAILDLINVMVYNFHGHFDSFVGHGSPLYASSLDHEHGLENLTVATGIEYWINKGADPAKINLGIAAYGRTFTLADPLNTQLYAPSIGGGNPGPYTNQTGYLGYNEFCQYHEDYWTYVWDDEQKVPHSYGDVDQWIGYENEESLGYKVQYALDKKLGGFMLWALDTDDFRGTCGKKYPILTSINSQLDRNKKQTVN